MATKNNTAQILKQMEEGTEEIFSRYEKLIRATEASYNSKIRALDKKYQKEASFASARADVDLKNMLERMADSGYTRAGETVQAQAYANAQRSAAMSALSLQHGEQVASFEAEKAKTSASLLAEAEKEIGEYKTGLYRAQLEQANLDREYEAQLQRDQRAQENWAKEYEAQLQRDQRAQENWAKEYEAQLQRDQREQENWVKEYEAARKQESYENHLAEEKLKLESSEKNGGSSGIEPEMTAYDYLNEIVKKHTTYNNKERYKVVDRKGILQSISRIVKDTNISYRYRYELYLYGKTLGYIS